MNTHDDHADVRPPADEADLRLVVAVERGVTLALLSVLCVIEWRAPAAAAVAALVAMRLAAPAWTRLLLAGRDRRRVIRQLQSDGLATAAAAACGLLLAAAPIVGAPASAVFIAVAIAFEIAATRRSEPPFAATGAVVGAPARRLAASVGFPAENIIFDDDAEATAQLIRWRGEPYIILAGHVGETYDDGAVAALVAHELAHHAHADLFKAAAGRVAVLAAAGAVAAGAFLACRAVGGRNAAAVAVTMVAIFEVLALPVMLALSRRTERRAHLWALAATNDPEAFAAAMLTLHHDCGSPPEPTWWSKLLICEHPSLNDTLRLARDFADRRADKTDAET